MSKLPKLGFNFGKPKSTKKERQARNKARKMITKERRVAMKEHNKESATTRKIIRRLGIQDDVQVELRPKMSLHAKQRKKEGRKGRYIYTPNKKRNKMVVVTKLPVGQARTIPFVKMKRKPENRITLYRFK